MNLDACSNTTAVNSTNNNDWLRQLRSCSDCGRNSDSSSGSSDRRRRRGSNSSRIGGSGGRSSSGSSSISSTAAAAAAAGAVAMAVAVAVAIGGPCNNHRTAGTASQAQASLAAIAVALATYITVWHSTPSQLIIGSSFIARNTGSSLSCPPDWSCERPMLMQEQNDCDKNLTEM